MSYRWPCIALLISVLPLQPLLAQTEPDTPAWPFGDTLDVNVVNVEVFVTDRDGKAVTGLDRDQFQIFEDGAHMPIAYFFAAEGPAMSGDTIATLAAEVSPDETASPGAVVFPVG